MVKETCPECKKKFKHLRQHFYNKHPDKVWVMRNGSKKVIPPSNQPSNLPKDSSVILPPEVIAKTEAKLPLQKVNEINLKPEFDSMKDVIEPKKEKVEADETQYKCGTCGCVDTKKFKHCPECGELNEWS